MGTAFAAEATHIVETGHLSAADIARATGANETTVRAWLRGARSPSGARAERLAELGAIVAPRAGVMNAESAPFGLRKPVPLLDDDKPLDVIAAGDYRRVSRLLAGLESPGVAWARPRGRLVPADPRGRRPPLPAAAPRRQPLAARRGRRGALLRRLRADGLGGGVPLPRRARDPARAIAPARPLALACLAPARGRPERRGGRGPAADRPHPAPVAGLPG